MLMGISNESFMMHPIFFPHEPCNTTTSSFEQIIKIKEIPLMYINVSNNTNTNIFNYVEYNNKRKII